MEGTNYGYLVNSTKTWLIVKDPAKLALAEEIFKDTGSGVKSPVRARNISELPWVLSALRKTSSLRKLMSG